MSKIRLSEILSIGCGGEAEALYITDAEGLRLKKGDFVLGRGTNILASDSGYDGRILIMRDNSLKVQGNKIYARAGATLPAITRAAAENGLSGLEWASGIPGSLGGGIFMNAGAYGGELGDYVSFVDVLTEDGRERVPASELSFGYRHTEGLNGIVIGAEFQLKKVSDCRTVYGKMREYTEKRRLAQPGGRTFGSTFKRVGGISAGYYIDKAGLKGRRRGGAVVSSLHANFIVNEGGATAMDVRMLIDEIKLKVFSSFNVRLEEEVIYLGEF